MLFVPTMTKGYICRQKHCSYCWSSLLLKDATRKVLLGEQYRLIAPKENGVMVSCETFTDFRRPFKEKSETLRLSAVCLYNGSNYNICHFLLPCNRAAHKQNLNTEHKQTIFNTYFLQQVCSQVHSISFCSAQVQRSNLCGADELLKYWIVKSLCQHCWW